MAEGAGLLKLDEEGGIRRLLTKLAWGKQGEQNGVRVWKPTWRMMGHDSWVKEQQGWGIH